MSGKTNWTDGQDTQIRRFRAEGAGWDVIAMALGLARWSVIERGRLLGVFRSPGDEGSPRTDPDRPALPAGHTDSWGAINRGTSLDGVRFRPPGALR